MNKKVKICGVLVFLIVFAFGAVILFRSGSSINENENDISMVTDGAFFFNLPDNLHGNQPYLIHADQNGTDRRRPSIMLITIDTLRADALGCYGAETAKTPVIDNLGANGILFENVM